MLEKSTYDTNIIVRNGVLSLFKGLNKVYVIIPYIILFRGTCNNVIYTPVNEVKKMTSSYEYDSDLDRVNGILNDISKSEFSLFDSECVASRSDEELDEHPVDWQQKTRFPDTWMKTIMATFPHVRYVLDRSCQTTSKRTLPGVLTISVCLFLRTFTRG